MLAVGVGCFWFSPKRAISGAELGKKPIARHLDDVKSALEGIDNVSDVEIVSDDMSFAEAAEEDTLDDGNEPLFIDGSVEFDLHLPMRVQQHYGHGRSIEWLVIVREFLGEKLKTILRSGSILSAQARFDATFSSRKLAMKE